MQNLKKLTIVASAALLTNTMAVPALAAPANQPQVTDSREAQRVDRVDVPEPKWEQCYPYLNRPENNVDPENPMLTAMCTKLVVPLDYDDPHGEKYSLRVLKTPAKDPSKKIGTLFVNPGGPTGSANWLAEDAKWYFSPQLLEKFDIVGVEPRGVGYNQPARCFNTWQEREQSRANMSAHIPSAGGDYVKYFNASRKLAQGCATKFNLHKYMSTSDVVRDMDVARRALGEEKLTFLGFSYGSVIGQYYANMFPDRFRAIANDGVVHANGWLGANGTGQQILARRLDSANTADEAFQKLIRACDTAGSEYCRSAATEQDPTTAQQKWDRILATLEKGPIRYVYEDVVIDNNGKITGTELVEHFITRTEVVDTMLARLYNTDQTGEDIDRAIKELITIMDSEDGQLPEAVAAGTQLHNRKKQFLKNMAALKGNPGPKTGSSDSEIDDNGYHYNGDYEAYSIITCADGSHPMLTPDHMRQADNMRHTAPVFGRAWGWSTVQCSRDTWSLRSPLAYQGPFNKQTSASMLFIGNRWDPATPLDQANKATRDTPGASLISSDSWGHTAYGTSDCVTNAVDEYLITGKPVGKIQCTGDYVPFKEPIAQQRSAAANPESPKARTITGNAPVIPLGSTALFRYNQPTK